LRSKKEKQKTKTDPNRRYVADEDSVRGQAREEKWVRNEWTSHYCGSEIRFGPIEPIMGQLWAN